MANLENNKDNNDKSIDKQIGKAVDKVTDKVTDTVKDAEDFAKDVANQAVEDASHYSWWAKLLLYLFYIGLGLVALAFIVINLPVTKDYAASRALVFLNKDLGIDVHKDKVTLNIFGDVTIEGLEIKDYKGYPFIKAKELRAESNWFSLLKSTNDISFDGMVLEKPVIRVITYKGDSIDNFNRFIANFENGKPRDPNKPLFHMDTRVQILDGVVTIVNQNHEGDAGKWLDAKNVNMFVPRLIVNGPDVSARINNFTFTTERWGKKHFVETFSTDFYLTKDALRFGDITINTDHSLLQGDIIFHQDPKTHFQDFTNKVKWDMNLKLGSQISGYDISYFVTNWDNYKPINVSGDMKGPLNNFSLKNFTVKSDDVLIHTATADVKDILKGHFLIKTNQLAANFDYKKLRDMFPSFVSKKMGNFGDVFGHIKYNGNATVDPNKVITNGNLITSIGQANVKSLTLSDFSSHQPKYVGEVYIKDFNTTAFTKNKVVGLITGNVNINGQGFDVNTLSLKTTSHIDNIQIMDRNIHNLVIDGTLAQKKFNGLVQVNDPQARAKLNGLIDFSTPRLFADVKTDIDYLNLNYFGYKADGNASISGTFDGKISMTNINDLNLDAQLQNIQFVSANQKFDIPNAGVKAYFENGNRIVDVDAPGAVKGHISGKYNIGDLAGMFQSGLGNVLVGYLPKRIYKGQNFDYSFDIEQKLVNYFAPEIHIAQGAHLDGNYQGNTNDLVLNANVPVLKYLMTKKEEISDADKVIARLNPDYKIEEKSIKTDSAMADSIHLKINTALDNEQLLANIKRIQYGNNVVKDIQLKGTEEQGKVLHLATTLSAGTLQQEEADRLKEYAINFNQTTDASGNFVVRFEPTSVKLNSDVWSIDTSENLNHSIVYRKKEGDFQFNNIRIFSEDSSVLINGIFKGAKDFDADLKIDNLQLSKVLAFMPNENALDIKGVANGTAKIIMNKSNLEPIIDLNVDNIKMNGQDMGNLVLNAKNSGKPNIFDVDARINAAGILGGNKLSLTGTVNNNTPSPTLDMKANLNDFNVAFAGEFVKTIFANLRGKANGEVSITGPLNNIDYSGNIAMSGLGFKFIFTGVDYTFADATIPLSKGLVQLNDLSLKDGRANSSGSISGIVRFQNVSSIGLDLIIRADNLLLLNTSQKDFDTFWGRVTAKGDVYVSGPVTALNLDANANILGGSEFTLNTNTTSSVEEFKMLRFLKVDEKTGQVSISQKANTGTNMNVGLVLGVDKNSTVNVLVGDDIGNISVRGDAKDLKFNMNRSGLMTMNGIYAVDNGTFVSKAILERTFQIQKGSNISWDGDVMNPDLNIVANYYRVVSNLGDYLNVGRLQPTNVQLQIEIKNKMKELSTPGAIQMNIQLPDASSQIREALAAKVNTEDEKIKQIGSILVMNSFNTSTSMNDINIESTAISTGYSMLFKNLASVFNAISNDFQIDMDYIRGDQASNTADRANTSLNLTVSPRVKIKTGIGIPIARTADAQNNYLSGEGTIEYDMSKQNDGSLVLHAYSKPANIGLVVGSNASENQSYGVGVAYSKSFNRFGDLFGKRKNKDRKKNKKNNSAVNDSIKK